jgi:hypothetical protein
MFSESFWYLEQNVSTVKLSYEVLQADQETETSYRKTCKKGGLENHKHINS